MMNYANALDIIARTVRPLAASMRGLDDLDYQATAVDVTARTDVPAFANSAMDGYALRSADTVSASDTDPVCLTVQVMIAAGDVPGQHVNSGHAAEIMTGAPVPGICDAVVPVERVEKIDATATMPQQIVLRQPVPSGANIRRPAEDYRRGDTVVRGGEHIEPHNIMGMAATGNDEVSTRPPPRVAIVTTGNELTTTGLPGATGLIRDANGPYLGACLRSLGSTLTILDRVSDTPTAVQKSLRVAQEGADVVLTTGGVSAGRYDIVPQVVTELGGEILFHNVAIRPGKPLLFARLVNNAVLFGLPGNPIAVAACLRFFVVPALRRMQGLAEERFHAARAVEDIRKKPGLRWFGKAHVEVNNRGQLDARLLAGQESFKINSLVQSNAWVIVHEDAETIRAGELVEVAPLYPTGFLQ